MPQCWDAVVLANGPIQANRPKWLGEGAKGLLGRGSKSLKKGSCTTKTLFCTGATQHFTGAKGIWPDCTQRPFAPSPNHFGAISLNPVICQDHNFPITVRRSGCDGQFFRVARFWSGTKRTWAHSDLDRFRDAISKVQTSEFPYFFQD